MTFRVGTCAFVSEDDLWASLQHIILQVPWYKKSLDYIILSTILQFIRIGVSLRSEAGELTAWLALEAS